MRVNSLGRGFLLLCLLFVVNAAEEEHIYEVVGIGECGDCKENKLKTNEAFEGLHVSIDCKVKNGEIKKIGGGELDKEGKFKIQVEDGQTLKEECYAHLHSAIATRCSADDGPSKIIFKSKTNSKTTFGLTKTLRFSTEFCTSKFLWPYFKHPLLPSTHPWKKNFPKINFPPLKSYGHNWPPIPIYKPKPPVYIPPKTPIPVHKPPKTPIPVHKPPKTPVPVYKPPKTPVPVYKPPKTPVPVYKPPVVKPLPPPVPIYKPPVITKPLPPPIPPFYKKPCPPLPPFPKIPPKYFHHHHKFGYFPPIPPSIPHHP